MTVERDLALVKDKYEDITDDIWYAFRNDPDGWSKGVIRIKIATALGIRTRVEEKERARINAVIRKVLRS